MANAVDPSGRELVERRHAGTVEVLVDGGEGGGGEVDPVGVVEKERMDVWSVDDAGDDAALLVVGKEEEQAASSESVVTEVQNVFPTLREEMGETADIIEHEGPRPLDAIHDFHDALAVFQLLKDEGSIIHAFGYLQCHNPFGNTSIPPNTSPFHRNTSSRSFISGCF